MHGLSSRTYDRPNQYVAPSPQIDAVLTLLAASRYPYLIAYIDQLYIQDSQSVRFVYSAVAIATLVISITTAVASFKSATNFVLVVSRLVVVMVVVVVGKSDIRRHRLD